MSFSVDYSPWLLQTLQSAIHEINHYPDYPADKYLGNTLRYPVDSVTHLLNND